MPRFLAAAALALAAPTSAFVPTQALPDRWTAGLQRPAVNMMAKDSLPADWWKGPSGKTSQEKKNPTKGYAPTEPTLLKEDWWKGPSSGSALGEKK